MPKIVHNGETSGRKYAGRPLVGVGAVVLNADDVLLVRRGKAPRMGQWSLPGGAQKLGETVFDAARREVREETGVEIEILGLLDVVDSISRDPAGDIDYHYTLVDVAATWRAGSVNAGGDAAEAVWVPRMELSKLDLWSETARMIELAFDRYRR